MNRPPTVLAIRNMVCDRCIRVVREELSALGLDVRRVDLGEAEVAEGRRPVNLDSIRNMLQQNGFELIEDRRRKTVESIKREIVMLVHHAPRTSGKRPKLSTQLATALKQDFHALSVLFSSTEGITIEQFLIRQRIERVKELLKYEEQTLSEMAWELGYSSVQHLSNQFRRVTGMTPSAFRKMGKVSRTPLDKV
ncbi:MAG: helix-turn-helix transcriptional regulator [Bacteroidetes bacterium]|jgi:AraC-like DNA-binding protein|nr:helix-turn-helix transcriptional regulator [Bacteroidota bacterium]